MITSNSFLALLFINVTDLYNKVMLILLYILQSKIILFLSINLTSSDLTKVTYSCSNEGKVKLTLYLIKLGCVNFWFHKDI